MVTVMPSEPTKKTIYEPGSMPYTGWSIKSGQAKVVEGGLIEEILLSLYVNGQELATLMCSPIDQEALALGFLYTEGVIRSRDDVKLIRSNVARTLIDIFLDAQPLTLPRRMVRTSACGGGISRRDLAETYPPLTSDLAITPEVIVARMRDLNDSAHLYQQVRGVHTSILGNAEELLISAEDIGRHNTIDKLAGKALQAGIDTRDSILVTSGRISSEMVGKARQMGVPIVASRTAPTSIAVNLATAWHICVVGYVRQNGMRVYTHPHRLGLPDVPEQTGKTDGRRNETLTVS
jgi:FdhD protein